MKTLKVIGFDWSSDVVRFANERQVEIVSIGHNERGSKYVVFYYDNIEISIDNEQENKKDA